MMTSQFFSKHAFRSLGAKLMMVLMALLTHALNGEAQQKIKIDHPVTGGSSQAVPDKKGIYTTVEKTAEFPGGMNSFYKFLAKNVRYPAIARETDVSGKVFVNFVVEKNGSLTNFKVLKGPGHGLDEEAVRALKTSPLWKPGYQKGKKVRQYFTVPISFTLSDDKKASTQKTTPIIDPVGDNGEVATFPGGAEKMYAYLAKTLHYPQAAREKNVQGKVLLNFVVEEDGEITDIHVLRGIGAGCDEEAIKAVENSPKWVPRKVNGQPARSVYTLPINFSLAKS